MLSIRFSGATKLLNPQPQSVSCSLSICVCVCVAIIHSNGFSNTIYAGKESEAKLQNTQRARAALARLPLLDLSPTPPTAIANCPWDCQLGLGAAHMSARRGGAAATARMCSSSLQIKFADKLHLPFAIALSVSISLSSPPLPRLSSIFLYSFSIFHYNFHSKHLRD